MLTKLCRFATYLAIFASQAIAARAQQALDLTKNGAFIAEQSTTGHDVQPKGGPVVSPAGVVYSVKNGRPTIFWHGGVNHAIPTTATDFLALLKALPGCSNAGWLLSPTAGQCFAPAQVKTK